MRNPVLRAGGGGGGCRTKIDCTATENDQIWGLQNFIFRKWGNRAIYVWTMKAMISCTVIYLSMVMANSFNSDI